MAEIGHVAIIGGTGFDRLPPDMFAETVVAATPGGDVEALSVAWNYVEPSKLFFLPRHGAGHILAPHQIDHKRNMLGLRALGVKYVFATNAVGSLRPELGTGSLIVLSDFIYIASEPGPSDTDGARWNHTDFSVPYSPSARSAILTAASSMSVLVNDGGIYLGCRGPRFETPAEVKLFAAWGADVVGMTGAQEAIAAKEAGLEYAALAIVTNLGAGLTPGPLSHGDVSIRMREFAPLAREILLTAGGILIENLQRSQADS